MKRFRNAAIVAAMATLPLAAVQAQYAPQPQDYGRHYGDDAPPPPPPGGYDRYAQNRGGPGQWQGDRQGWDPSRDYHGDDRYREHREMGPNDRVYRGHDGRYYCKRSNGTTGLIAGAVGGGLLGNVLGGGTLGTLLGAGGGALLGKHLDKRHDEAQNERNGYYCE